MSKHTPGPWRLDPCSNGGLILRRGEAINGDRHPQSHLQIVPIEDAYLIAAAPDLLAACKDLMSFDYQRDVVCQLGLVDYCRCRKCVEKRAESAIAKAEGVK